uniref:Uncharacterized protein n=1 Tax=Equus caballus TaxID=9796 RepID=F6V9R2_HORSE
MCFSTLWSEANLAGAGPLSPQPQDPLPWMLPSLFAAFNVELLLILSGLFFAFPCRWLVQNREWVDPVVTGPLFILTFFSLVSLNVSDPGILHQGSNELGPMMVPVVWVNHRAFRLQWCPRCCFHHPPRTHHCPWCNICVEVSAPLICPPVLSLCLFSGAMLVTVLMFPVYRTQLPFSMDEIVANLVAVPAAGFLEPLFVLLLIKARSVSAAERCHEGKVRGPGGGDQARRAMTPSIWLVLPRYMAEAVGLQRVVGPDWVPMQTLHCPMGPSEPSLPAVPGPGSGSLCTGTGSGDPPSPWWGGPEAGAPRDQVRGS